MLLLAHLLFVFGGGSAGFMLVLAVIVVCCWTVHALVNLFVVCLSLLVVGLAGVHALVSLYSAWQGWECQCICHTRCHCGSVVIVLHLTGC